MLRDVNLATCKLMPTPNLCTQHRLLPSWAKPGTQGRHALSFLVQSLAHCPRPWHNLGPAPSRGQAPGCSHPYCRGRLGAAHAQLIAGLLLACRQDTIPTGTLWRQLGELSAITGEEGTLRLQVQQLDRPPHPAQADG